ncbi:zeta toxin family protein [Streptomyces sp. NPDC056661]|uniref:zeta toxin family protein n=1 Tax=Streptomyces sp. NPDC056661 TaxID=3345898 RepID=UPI003676530D
MIRLSTGTVNDRRESRRARPVTITRQPAGGDRLPAFSDAGLATRYEKTASVYPPRTGRPAAVLTEIVAVTVPEALSRLGILNRLPTETADASRRFVSWENRDSCVKGMLASLATIEAEHLADWLTVVRRDDGVLYDNELMHGVWHRRPTAEKAAAAKQWRPGTPAESAREKFHRERGLADHRLAVRGRRAGSRCAWASVVGRPSSLHRPGSRAGDHRKMASAGHRDSRDPALA